MHSDPRKIWERGACREAPDKDIFYPDRDAETYSEVARKARRYCHGDGPSRPRCPVILDCLFYGLITEDKFGIWGGMSVRERSALRRAGTLDKYRPVQDLNGHPKYVLIEDYLRQREEHDEPRQQP